MVLDQHTGLCLTTDHKVDSTDLLYTITDHKVDSTDHHKDIMELHTTVKEDLEEEDEERETYVSLYLSKSSTILVYLLVNSRDLVCTYHSS